MADDKKKIGIETAVLALVLIVMIGGFWMTWRVIAENTDEAATKTRVKVDAVHMSIKQVSERVNRLSKQMQATTSAAVETPPADDTPDEAKKDDGDDKEKP